MSGAGATAAAPAPAGPAPRVSLLGLGLDVVTAQQAIDHIIAELGAGRGGWVVTPNLAILRRHSIDPAYAATIAGATLRVADGMPLIWASRLRGTPLPERIAGSELIWSLSARASVEGRSIFMVGGNPGAAKAAGETLRRQYPGLRVAGEVCPPMGFERDEAYLMELERTLAGAAPDICYVGLNFEKQDALIARLRPRFPGTWFLGIGISFSYVCGEVRHAPVWVRRIGLEWFFRLVQEPRRLARRYLLEGLPFAVRLFWGALADRIRGRGAGRGGRAGA